VLQAEPAGQHLEHHGVGRAVSFQRAARLRVLPVVPRLPEPDRLRAAEALEVRRPPQAERALDRLQAAAPAGMMAEPAQIHMGAG